MADQWTELQKAALNAVDENSGALGELSHAVWANPELNFKETVCHGVLCDFLEKHDFRVTRGYVLDTAFRAEYGDDSDGTAPHVMLICEYDALPELGHACGHNLIAECGVGAALGVQAAMKAGGLTGKLTVLGTPAEEGGGGKQYLLDAGCCDGVTAALMAHPAPFNAVAPTMLAIQNLAVTFTGRASHASAAPWLGINALDAAVMAYNGLSVLRQQLRPTARVQGIITNGGAKANIIPDLASLDYILREETTEFLEELKQKVEGVMKGAAQATGCQVSLDWYGRQYDSLLTSPPLADVYRGHVTRLDPGWSTLEGGEDFKGSTDMGNISQTVPSIHPLYHIGPEMNHTRPFTQRAGSAEAQGPTLIQAKALALTALAVLTEPGLGRRALDHFRAATSG